jgi:hypothetical protein
MRTAEVWSDFTAWAESRPLRMGARGRTCRDIWDDAPRGEWLLRYAEKAGVPHPALVRAAAACARHALRFVPEGEDRPRLAIEAAERWADQPTEDNRRKAKRAADASWASAAAWPTASGASGASWASRAASSSAAWTAAALAARYAARAHGDAEGPESEAAAHRACAEEVRRLVPFVDLAGQA